MTETAAKSIPMVRDLNAMWDEAHLSNEHKILLLRTMSHIETLTRELTDALNVG